MCTSPLTLKIQNARYNGKWVVVGCGKCDECKRKYQNTWAVRLANECKVWDNVWFITLTYRPDSIPMVVDKETGELHNSVCKIHVQKWLKKYRVQHLRENGEIIHLKYFLTSEYGPRTLRPHYHMLLFGLSALECKQLCNIWENDYGFVACKKIKNSQSDSYAVSKYVAKYCSKGSFENPYVAQKRVKPTFHLISKGIGYKYVLDMKDYHLCNDKKINKYGTNNYCDRYQVVSNTLRFSSEYVGAIVDRLSIKVLDQKGRTITYPMPRYYKEKIFGVQNTLSDCIAEEILQRDEQLRLERTAQLQAEHQDWSFDKAYGFTFFQDIEVANFRAKENRRKAERFYNKSRL